MNRYFISGTDTDCGKTYITVQLLKLLNQQQHQTQALKPIASGAKRVNDQLLSDDVLQLQAANVNKSLAINQWLFEEPIAPHLAARHEHIMLSVEEIQRFCDQDCFAHFETLLIEGAGGLCVPINSRQTWIDFVQLMQIPVIFVVGMRLGCINHALLSASLMQQKSVSCVGWIANCLQPSMLALEENIQTLTEMMPFPLLGIARYGTSLVLNNNYRFI